MSKFSPDYVMGRIQAMEDRYVLLATDYRNLKQDFQRLECKQLDHAFELGMLDLLDSTGIDFNLTAHEQREWPFETKWTLCECRDDECIEIITGNAEEISACVAGILRCSDQPTRKLKVAK